MPEVILVNDRDQAIGTMEKMAAHRQGKLHRAFSILIFNHLGEMLLQRRAKNKYHSGGLWTNACCSHPRPDEEVAAAASRRLQEEMGFVCPLEFTKSFIYKAEFTNKLIEHEFDHVFVGQFDGEIKPNPEEADGYKWIEVKKLRQDMIANPDRYTPWFKIIMQKYYAR